MLFVLLLLQTAAALHALCVYLCLCIEVNDLLSSSFKIRFTYRNRNRKLGHFCFDLKSLSHSISMWRQANNTKIPTHSLSMAKNPFVERTAIIIYPNNIKQLLAGKLVKCWEMEHKNARKSIILLFTRWAIRNCAEKYGQSSFIR